MCIRDSYQTLRALSRPSIPDELIRYIYELKVLVVNGECPVDFEKLDLCEATPVSYTHLDVYKRQDLPG